MEILVYKCIYINLLNGIDYDDMTFSYLDNPVSDFEMGYKPLHQLYFIEIIFEII